MHVFEKCHIATQSHTYYTFPSREIGLTQTSTFSSHFSVCYILIFSPRPVSFHLRCKQKRKWKDTRRHLSISLHFPLQASSILSPLSFQMHVRWMILKHSGSQAGGRRRLGGTKYRNENSHRSLGANSRARICKHSGLSSNFGISGDMFPLRVFSPHLIHLYSLFFKPLKITECLKIWSSLEKNVKVGKEFILKSLSQLHKNRFWNPV